jgi:DNA primase
MNGQVEEIKSRLSIDDVVGSYIILDKAGKYLRACCPFHNEKSASFYVSPERGTYYCFGCNEKGDIFNFIMKYEGVDFKAALTSLALRAGIKLNTQETFSSYVTQNHLESVYQVIDAACFFYSKSLSLDKEAIDYIQQRKITKETIDKFRIGYAPNEWHSLTNYLLNKGFSEKTILEAGLAIKKENKKSGEKSGIYDRFRGRIMFPIEDSSSRVIAFTGRILPQYDDGKTGKYINSPETELYHKSSVFYGFSKAKDSIRKNDFCILVEGQFDVVLSHQNGFMNTIAVSGTAFDDALLDQSGALTHFGILSRLSKNIILALDHDTAGQRATSRILKMTLPMGFNLKIIPPDNDGKYKDAADIFCSENGAISWKKILMTKVGPIRFTCLLILKKESLRENQLSLIKTEIFPIMYLYPGKIEILEATKIIETYFAIPYNYILEDFEIFAKKQKTKISFEEKQDINNHVEIKKEVDNIHIQNFIGLYYASSDTESKAYKYREKILSFIESNIPNDYFEKHKNYFNEDREPMSMKSDITIAELQKPDIFIEEVLLKYEEYIFRDIMDILRNKLTINPEDMLVSHEYNKTQKKIQSIKEKLRTL